ncbi:endo-1,3(4)-beta-glucanase [Blastomyces silverae]|uniref:endo-1,3(4)-beta-glucanase n=1 Tax=Blastomyces silverae TaxID=2060906 RepID=A0A0H1BDJ1_9EURO|nr:endo-1,3(4)-beta-glucanase [Blastomyces silverae]
MHLSVSILICVNSFVGFSQAAYTLIDDYTAKNFLQTFEFFSGDDPTHGYVNYLDRAAAHSQGLLSTADNVIYMGVDSTNVASGRGRSSIRVTSKKAYDNGLIIADIEHMPGGICGTWPAFWTFGPNWPNNGEIDIIEGVHKQASNLVAMHTTSGCRIINSGNFTGTLLTPNCDVNAPGQPPNAGCTISSSDSTSYGRGFNANGGGVYAMEITASAVTVWFFPRNAIPEDIHAATPYPASWPRPMAQFKGACDIAAHIKLQKIVFDTTFCGDWAGNVWSTSRCASKAPTCQEFVQHNPTAFKQAYWRVKYVRTFENSNATYYY